MCVSFTDFPNPLKIGERQRVPVRVASKRSLWQSKPKGIGRGCDSFRPLLRYRSNQRGGLP